MTRPDTLHSTVPEMAAVPEDDADLPEIHETPLGAVVPYRRIGEVVPRWEATLPGFLQSLFLAVSPGTARTYLEALTRFIQAVGDPLEATPADIEGFLSRPLTGRQGRAPGPRAASSRVVELAALRRYARWAQREQLRVADPTAAIELRRGEPYRDLRALGVTLAYAARCKVPRGPGRPVFPGRWGDVPLAPRHVTRLITAAALAAGITVPRPVHALRHSYARLLRDVGASVEDVQHSLDHASLATTSTYLRKLEGSDDPFGPRLVDLLLGPAPTTATG